MARKNPSLSGLGSIEGFVDKVLDPKALEGLGWAAAGGAAGGFAMGFAMPIVRKIPFIDRLPGEITEMLGGAALARLAWEWNEDFAKGLAGATVGRSVGAFVSAKLLPMVGLSGLGYTSDQIPPPSDRLRLDPATFAEVEMDQLNGLASTVEDQAPLGSWIS